MLYKFIKLGMSSIDVSCRGYAGSVALLLLANLLLTGSFVFLTDRHEQTPFFLDRLSVRLLCRIFNSSIPFCCRQTHTSARGPPPSKSKTLSRTLAKMKSLYFDPCTHLAINAISTSTKMRAWLFLFLAMQQCCLSVCWQSPMPQRDFLSDGISAEKRMPGASLLCMRSPGLHPGRVRAYFHLQRVDSLAFSLSL
jgi:hypothetical protein